MLEGKVILVKSLAHHPIWLGERFNRAQAWVDLLLLANDRPREFRPRGITVKLTRGQVGWSAAALGARWQWCREKVSGYLRELETRGMIKLQMSKTLTVISITNFEVYQIPPFALILATELTSKLTTESATDLTTELATELASKLASKLTSEPARNREEGIRVVGVPSGVPREEEGGRGKGEVQTLSARDENSGEKQTTENSLPDSNIPTAAEVIAFGACWPGLPTEGIGPCIPREFCQDYWDYTDTKNRWVPQPGGALIKWRNELVRFWRKDHRTWKPSSAKPLTHAEMNKLRDELDEHNGNHHGGRFQPGRDDIADLMKDFDLKLKRFKEAGGVYRWPDDGGIA